MNNVHLPTFVFLCIFLHATFIWGRQVDDRPLTSKKESISSSVIGQHMSRDDPHYYKPLPLPLNDALHYVKRYGPYAGGRKRHSTVKLQLAPEQCVKRERPLHCKRNFNGCGSGFTLSVPLLFRDKFTPSCNKHDVCYDCGTTRNWTREQCDEALYQDASDVCDCEYPGLLASAERLACKEMAEGIYMAVRVFSESYFSRSLEGFCQNDCVVSYGSPELKDMV